MRYLAVRLTNCLESHRENAAHRLPGNWRRACWCCTLQSRPAAIFARILARRAAQKSSVFVNVKQHGRGQSMKKCALLTLF